MTASNGAAPSRLPQQGHGFSQNSPETAFGASIDPADVARFSAQAAEWWDAHGPFAPLHRFNPARLKLIREQLCARLGRDAGAIRPFEGLTLLDVGCGGGLIAGCAIAAKAMKPDIKVFGVEAARYPSFTAKRAGKPPVCTGQTIAAVAARHHLPVTLYAAGDAASAFAARLRAAHPTGSVLIAGHSNTVPGIVAALCQCEAAEMPDHEYDRLSIVRITPGQPPALDVSRYGEASVHP